MLQEKTVKVIVLNATGAAKESGELYVESGLIKLSGTPSKWTHISRVGEVISVEIAVAPEPKPQQEVAPIVQKAKRRR